jgi:hypothetical protein
MIQKPKILKALKQLLKITNESHLTQDEVVVLIGNYCYSVGLCMIGRTKNPPTQEELETSYLMKPMIENFLMLTGLNIAARISPAKEEKKENRL